MHDHTLWTGKALSKFKYQTYSKIQTMISAAGVGYGNTRLTMKTFLSSVFSMCYHLTHVFSKRFTKGVNLYCHTKFITHQILGWWMNLNTGLCLCFPVIMQMIRGKKKLFLVTSLKSYWIILPITACKNNYLLKNVTLTLI